MPDGSPYEPVKYKECPRCHGTGLVHVHKRGSPYEPPGRLMCLHCNGTGFIRDRPEPDDM